MLKTDNLGKEALELAEKVSTQVKFDREIQENYEIIHKYRFSVKNGDEVVLPTFITQKNSIMTIEISGTTPEGTTGSVKVQVNNNQIETFDIPIESIKFSFFVDRTNVIKLIFALNQTTVFTDITARIYGKFVGNNMSCDNVYPTSTGYCLVQKANNVSHRFVFTNIEQVLSNYKNLVNTNTFLEIYDCSPGYVIANDVCTKNQNFVLYKNSNGITVRCFETISENSLCQTGISGCLIPYYSNGRFVAYYLKSSGDVCYRVVVAIGNISEEIEVNIPSKYVVKKIKAVRPLNTSTASYSPHFIFIDANDDAYIMICSTLGEYSSPKRLGKANDLICYIDGVNLTCFLSYDNSVVKLTVEISSLGSNSYIVMLGRKKIENASFGFMDELGNCYYKFNNCIVGESE